MSNNLKGNAVIGQSGGPTAVINQSLVGVIREAKKAGHILDLLGARHAVRGIVNQDFIALEKYPDEFDIDMVRCIYCGMCEQACPCDAIELTSLFDLTGLSREEMMFDKEKLLSVFDQTKNSPKDPVRSSGGPLSVASEPPK